MITVLMVAFMAAAAQALPFTFGDRLSHFDGHQNTVRDSFGVHKAPLNPFPGGGEEVTRWMQAVGPMRVAPENSVQDRAGPSIYDNYRPPADPQAAASRTLWFDEFPHRRVVLNWQEERLRQGLPVYKLLSQRPGFPFYQGN